MSRDALPREVIRQSQYEIEREKDLKPLQRGRRQQRD